MLLIQPFRNNAPRIPIMFPIVIHLYTPYEISKNPPSPARDKVLKDFHDLKRFLEDLITKWRHNDEAQDLELNPRQSEMLSDAIAKSKVIVEPTELCIAPDLCLSEAVTCAFGRGCQVMAKIMLHSYTEYDCILYMDADVLITEPMGIYELFTICATNVVRLRKKYCHMGFSYMTYNDVYQPFDANQGVILLRPSSEDFNRLVDIVRECPMLRRESGDNEQMVHHHGHTRASNKTGEPVETAIHERGGFWCDSGKEKVLAGRRRVIPSIFDDQLLFIEFAQRYPSRVGLLPMYFNVLYHKQMPAFSMINPNVDNFMFSPGFMMSEDEGKYFITWPRVRSNRPLTEPFLSSMYVTFDTGTIRLLHFSLGLKPHHVRRPYNWPHYWAFELAETNRWRAEERVLRDFGIDISVK